MSDVIARVRAQIAHATHARFIAVSVDVKDLETLLAIAEQPALTIAARFEEDPCDIPDAEPGFSLTFEQAVLIGRRVDAIVNASIGDPT